MEQYGTIVMVVGLVILMLVLCEAFYTAGKNSTYKMLHEARMEGYNDGWQSARKSMDEIGRYNKSVDESYVEGFNKGYGDAKKVFYDDPMAERRAEDDRIRKLIEEENKTKPVAAELLMAFGVTNVSQLPKSVRQQYGLTTDDSIDLESIIAKEVESDGRY